MTDKIEQYLARIAVALEKIEKNTRPAASIDFTDAKVIESFWGGQGPMHS